MACSDDQTAGPDNSTNTYTLSSAVFYQTSSCSGNGITNPYMPGQTITLNDDGTFVWYTEAHCSCNEISSEQECIMNCGQDVWNQSESVSGTYTQNGTTVNGFEALGENVSCTLLGDALILEIGGYDTCAIITFYNY